MRIVLDTHACTVQTGEWIPAGKTESGSERRPLPHLYVLKGALIFRCTPHVRIWVDALLDTGCEITMLKPGKASELEDRLGHMMPLERVFYHGSPVPAYDLAFVLPSGHLLSSHYLVIAPAREEFDVADLWLGQDIFNQLVVTFDGINGTVTMAAAGEDS